MTCFLIPERKYKNETGIMAIMILTLWNWLPGFSCAILPVLHCLPVPMPASPSHMPVSSPPIPSPAVLVSSSFVHVAAAAAGIYFNIKLNLRLTAPRGATPVN